MELEKTHTHTHNHSQHLFPRTDINTDVCVCIHHLVKSLFFNLPPLCVVLDGACQMKGWRRCALTLRSLTEGHPDLRPCLCPGEGERPCALLRQLHTHCLPHTHTGDPLLSLRSVQGHGLISALS